eukprot:scaffold7695_cov124-Isochrysis_galbana.AAC.8
MQVRARVGARDEAIALRVDGPVVGAVRGLANLEPALPCEQRAVPAQPCGEARVEGVDPVFRRWTKRQLVCDAE